jgi:hypothetical protein
MNDTEKLEAIRKMVADVKPPMDDETLQDCMEGGWGGNFDDAFAGGDTYGTAHLAQAIREVLETK